MKLPVHLIIFLFILNCTTAAAASTLMKAVRLGSGNSAQVFFTFDTLPSYYKQITGKRLDVVFEDTIVSESFATFAPDDKIIKVLSDQHNDLTRVSMFFRYPPLDTRFEVSADNKLVLEIRLGTQYSRTFKDFSQTLEEISALRRDTVDYTNPLVSSPYATDWPSFIKTYESPITIPLPVEYSLPPFPIINLIPGYDDKRAQLFPDEIFKLSEMNIWDEVQNILLSMLTQNPDLESQKLLALTYGETLLRQNNFEGAYKQFYLLEQKYPDEHVGLWARYLLYRAIAEFGDPYIAEYNLKGFAEQIAKTSTLAAYTLLTQIEIALATKQYDTMADLLAREDTPLPKNVLPIKEMRQADFFYATQKYTKAYVSYNALENKKVLNQYPSSHNGYCDVLYRHKDFKAAASCYSELEKRNTQEGILGLVSFRKAMAEMKYTPIAPPFEVFLELETIYQNKEAGIRAALKRVDLRYLNSANWAEPAARRYHELSTATMKRELVEEALFKEALMYMLIDQADQSLPILMQLNRDFNTSNLQFTTEALLIKILPEELRRLIQENRYLDALTLAKQNKKYFQKNWISSDVIIGLAKAYQRSGLYRDAEETYLYLLETLPPTEREKFFLPLIQVTYAQGSYEAVDDYGSQYQYLHPEGKDLDEILDIRLQSLILLRRYKDALALLKGPLTEDKTTQMLAATIYFHMNEYTKAETILLGLEQDSLALPPRQRFILAECMFQTGDQEKAEELFSSLEAGEYHFGQTLYRLAQIAQSRGDVEKSLKLYKKIVETGEESVWLEYAQRELKYHEIIDRLSY